MAFVQRFLSAKGIHQGLLFLSLITLPLFGLANFVEPDRIPGDLGDARFNMFVLEHGYRWLTGQEPSFWHADFFFPTEDNTIAYSDSHIGNLPIYGALRILGLPYDRSFQAWIVIVFSLNFASALAVLLRFGPHKWEGAITGAFVFAFGLPVMQQLGHIQLVPRYFIPPAFYFLHRFFTKGRSIDFSFAAGSVVAQFLISIYTGVFLVFGLTIFAMISVLSMRRSKRCPFCSLKVGRIIALTATIAISGLILLPYLYPYYKTAMTHSRSWVEVLPLLPALTSYWLPAETSTTWIWMKDILPETTASHEHRMFLGLLPTASTLLFMFLLRKHKKLHRYPVHRALLLSWVLLVLLTLRWPGGLSLYVLLFNYLPGISALRAIARISLLFTFFGAVMTAWAVNRCILLSRRHRKRGLRGTVVYVLFIAVLVTDQWTANHAAFSIEGNRQRIEAIATQLRESDQPRPSSFFLIPDGQPFFYRHVDAMLASQQTGIPTINGYSGNIPQDYSLELLLDDPSEHLCRAIAAWMMMNGKIRIQGIRLIGKNPCQGGGHESMPNLHTSGDKQASRQITESPFTFKNEAIVYRMDDPSIRTIVGEKKGSSLLSTTQGGVLTFGPYTSLPAGVYRITWDGILLQGSEAEARIEFDVAGNMGKETMASALFESREVQKIDVPFRKSIVFEIVRPTPNIEFRIFVQDGIRLQLNKVTLSPENDIKLSKPESPPQD